MSDRDVDWLDQLCEADEKIAELESENAKLRDQLRWRKWPEESPSESGFYLIGSHGLSYTPIGHFHAGHNQWDVDWRQFYWMPQIPLPGGEL